MLPSLNDRASFPTLDALEPRLMLSVATKIKILDAAGAEGSAVNPGQIVFTVKRIGSTVGTAKVKYRTIGLADADAADITTDLTAVAGRLVFKAGQKTKQITVNLVGNAVDEGSKRFGIQLFKPQNTKLAKSIGYGTIAEDDGADPAITINDIAVVESNSGTKTVNFTVTLSKVSGNVVTVQYKSSAGNAIAPEDYIAVPLQTLTFNPGQTTKTISVQIVGDTIPAQALFETFFMNLSNATNATIADSRGECTIQDNDL